MECIIPGVLVWVCVYLVERLRFRESRSMAYHESRTNGALIIKSWSKLSGRHANDH